MMSFSVLSAVLLLLHCLFSPTSSQSDCSEPSQSDLPPFINEFLLDSDGSLSYSPNIIGSVHYVCKAQGSTRGTYRSLSIIATFTPNPGASQTTRIFQLSCSSGSWEADLNGGIPAPVSGLVSASTRTDCVLCSHAFGSDRCRDCDSSCNTGLGRCVGSQTNCCPYFSPTDLCTTQCPANFNASSSNGFICTCNLSCEAGYTLDNSTCTCSLSNICELSPCQNGGSCTLVSAPSNYACDCTGTGYQGINCSASIFSIADSPPPTADWSTASSTHVVGILPMLTSEFISLVITTPETETVNFTVSSLTQTIASSSVTAGTPTTISHSSLLSYHVNSESERYKGLLVTTGTDKKISVAVAMSHFGDYSAGVYVNYPALVYPVNSYVYYAVSIGTSESTSFSSLLIVSGTNNTNITITPTVTVTIPGNLTSSGDQISLNAGQSITIQLQYLETLLLKPVAAMADLTGTKVESSNPISVYSGHTCGFIPVGQFACDFVGEQIPPVASWGNEFLVQSFYNRQSGYILKLIGSQNNTGIGITCDNGNTYSLSLQEDGVLSQTIPQTSCFINSTSPILVAQFSLAQFADPSFTSFGDPAMTIIPPLHQYASNATSFPIISLLGASTSVNLVVLAADDSSQIQLDGTLLPSLNSSSWKHYNSSVGGCYVLNSYSLSGSTGEISVWSNNSNDKILAMVYGLQQFVGYSYTGNLELKPSESCFLLCQANYVVDTTTCTCVIQNVCQGNNCTDSSYTAPNISALVSYVAVLNGSSITLRCVLHHAGNPNATIQWTFDGSVITNDSLFLITEGSTRLDITNITTSYSGAYHCNASNVAGASVATINVDVQEPPYFIVIPPNSVSLRYNNITTLNCSSGGVPLPNITWFKDGIVIPTDQYTSTNTSDTIITMLTVVGSLTSDGSYTCQAVNDLVERRVINATVNVIVHEPISYVGIDPTSSNITLNQSDTFITQCSFSGIPLPSVFWFFNGFLSNSSRVSITTDIQEITITSTLMVKSVDKATDEGVYRCTGFQSSFYYVFRNLSIACNNSCEAGYTLNTTTCTCSLSNICELSPCQNGGSCTLVSAPSNYTCDCTGTGYQGINCTNVNYTVPIISALVSYVAVLNGSSVTLRCVLHHAGNPNAAIQWTYAGSVITNDSLFLITEGSTRLDITNITTSYSGAYHCNASNIAGASVATINVDVQEPPYFIVIPPNSVSLRYNNITTLNCSSGGVPLPNITWFKDGIVIPTDQYTSTNTSDTIITMLTVVGSLTSDGSYTCQAVNDLVERRVINATVNVIVHEPISYVGIDPTSSNITLNQSDTFITQCSFSGIPLPSVFWFFNGFLSNSSRVSITTDIQEITITSTLMVKSVDKATDEGVYLCTGFQSSFYYVFRNLSIACNNSCEAGYTLNTTTCTCSLSNICELSPCQNGGSCTLVSAPSNYTCDCTGTGYQGINCTNVNYTVPIISALVSYVAVLNGSSVTLRCVLHHAGNPNAAIQWTYAGSVITNDSLFLITEGSTRLDITNITTSYSGAYHCNASNIAGASVATINVDVQEPPYFIVIPPNSVSLRYNNITTLNCSSGGVPLPNITWFKDGIVIPTDQYTSTNTSDTIITMLTVVGSLTSDGSYTCQAVNDLVERRVINATVNVIVHEPISYVGIDPTSSNITLNQSDTFITQCSFSGIPLPSVFWFFNGFLSNSSRVSITTDIQEITITSTLMVKSVDKATDEGVYLCTGFQSSFYYVFRNLSIACNNSCEAGYTLNTTTCTCSLSNICELSPCQNGGSCTLVSAPSNYTCDCTGTGYQGINCTNVNYTVPIISALVSYVAVLNGSSVTLRCVLHHAGNPNAAIQWTFSGSVITNDSLFLITEGSTRLDITNITTSYSGAYYCNASNIAGASVATINVDVQEPPYFIVIPPNSVSLRYNNITTLNCSSGGVPLPNITWFKDGIVIPTDQYTSTNTSDTIITMLTVVGSLTSGGNYTCQAVNDLIERRIVNTTVNVTVYEPLNVAGSDPPASVTLNQSDTFIANCSFSGIPLPTVTWFNGTFLDNSSRVSITTDIQGITVTSTLSIKNVDKVTDEGFYECIVFQQFSEDFFFFTLLLNIVCNNSCEAGYTLDNSTCTCSLANICELSPCQNGGSCTLVSAPSNYTCDCTGTGYQGINCTNFLGIPPIITASKPTSSVLNGSSATLICTLQNAGTPVATVTWRFNENTLSNSLKYAITYSTSTLPDTAGSTQLVINDVVMSDAGVYNCVASNGGGISTAEITLNVQVPPSIISISNVTQIRFKTNVTLTCTASGVPRPVVTWSKDGVELPNEQILNTYLSDSVLLSGFRFEGSLTSTGQYTCTAVNYLVERRTASRSLNILTYEPLQFNKGLIGDYSIQSEPYTAYCNYTALPHANVLWARDGVTLYSNAELLITTDEAGITLSSTLTIRNLNKERDEGIYTCTATSLQYSHTFSGKLQIEVPAVVRPDSNRFSAVINTTSHVSFSISNRNDLIRNHTIQWHFKRRGTNTYISLNSEIFDTSRLSDDGLRLLFSSAQLQHRGTYRITVSNAAANVTATTNFDVFVPAKLQYTAGMSIVKERQQNVSFNCSADGIPMPTIVWRKDGQYLIQNNKRSITEQSDTGFRSTSIPGVLLINSTLTITGLTGSDNGSYSCRADNEANIGSLLVEPFILSVVEPPPPDFCLSSPCVNNGDCHSLFDGYYCACPATHTGINCEEVVVVTVPPVITEPPQTTTSKLYTSTRLTCRATGSPTPSILWYKDNRLIPNTNPDSSVLLFDELLLSDRGFYHCVAVNIIDGKNVSVNSATVLLNITNVVQYEAEMVLPEDFYDDLNGTESEDAIRQLIIDSNNYLSGSNISDTSFFFIEILETDEDNPEPDSIPVVVTLVTERGQGDQMLLTGVRGQLDSLRQQLSVEISVAAVTRFDGCLSNPTIIPSPSGDPSLSLTVNWPETNIGVLSVVDCPCGSNGTSGGGALQATRYCGGDFTDGAMWLIADVGKCNFSDLARRICRLSDLPVNDKVEELETLTSNSSMLGSTEVAASVSVLVTATDELAGNLTLTMTFLEVVDNIIDVDQEVLQESQESSNTSARILEAIDNVVDNIPIANTSEPVVIAQKSFAVSVQEIDPEMFSRSGQTFSVNIADFTQQNISSGDLSFESNAVSPPTGTIQLPNNLFSSLPENISRISHAVFVTDSLFLRRSFSYRRVSSVIISASVVGAGTIRNLRPPVNLGFRLNPNVNGSVPQCTFWNQSLDDGYGDWSSDGCNTSSGSPDSQVTCNCDHLTNFAILLDVSPPEEPTERTALTLFLDSVSYIGIIISIICLIITIISYLLSKKLRSSDHGQLLLNLCFALMSLYLSFIVALHSKNTNGFCAFSGAILQYFFLVTFAIMAAEAINLYINLVIVLGRKIQSFALKVTIVSWVAPVFIVLLCFSPDYRNYISSPPNFCRAFKAPFYIGVVVPFSIIYVFNWIVFVIIIVSLLRKNFSSKLKELKKAKKDKSKSFFKQQLIIAITLSILFGLGWGLGLLVTQEIYTNKTVRDLFAALFVLLTAFHGFFIFIMHCLRSKDVRQVWKRAFFGVTGKDFTEFSSSTFNRVRRKSSGVTSTAMRSPHRKVSSEKSPSFSFSDGKSFFKKGATLQEYTKKKEAEDEGIKELEETGVMAVDNNAYASIEDTGFDFENDGQGTLRFYTKKDQDHEAHFDSLNDGKSAKKAKKEDVPPSKKETGLELDVNVSSEVKEEEPKAATAVAVKSFPDEDEDEKGRLREEEDQAYNAYHSKNESDA